MITSVLIISVYVPNHLGHPVIGKGCSLAHLRAWLGTGFVSGLSLVMGCGDGQGECIEGVYYRPKGVSKVSQVGLP